MSFRPIYTVSQLTGEIKNLLERTFEHVWIEGEISNLRVPGSGHLYFTLKDESSQVRAVLFRTQRRLLKFEPEDGLMVVGYGRISIYEPRGEYQLLFDHLEPKGLGALQLAFEQLKARLAAEGLFDAARKRPLPSFPRKIGVVTSPTGAAIRDILQIINRRFAGVHVLLCPARVQGPGAAAEIAQAIEVLNRLPELEVIIVARGGGSLEDLWAFNEEAVARAIYHSRLPVISAVGHEVDFTIADFVADLRAPTPSAAAELVVRNKVELVQTVQALLARLCQANRVSRDGKRDRISSLVHRLTDPRRQISDRRLRVDDFFSRLGGCVRQVLLRKAERMAGALERLRSVHPQRRVAEGSQQLSQLYGRLSLAGRAGLRFRRQDVESCAARLQTLSPLGILERGYSIARKIPSGEVIRRAGELKIEERVRVRVRRGEFTARVEAIRKDGENDPH